jgi:hypothetical protein
MEEMGLLSISPHCLPATSNTGQYMNHPRWFPKSILYATYAMLKIWILRNSNENTGKYLGLANRMLRDSESSFSPMNVDHKMSGPQHCQSQG